MLVGRTRAKNHINAEKAAPKGVKSKMRERNLRRDVDLKGALKQKCVKEDLFKETLNR
jgi:hypothetical protein